MMWWFVATLAVIYMVTILVVMPQQTLQMCVVALGACGGIYLAGVLQVGPDETRAAAGLGSAVGAVAALLLTKLVFFVIDRRASARARD